MTPRPISHVVVDAKELGPSAQDIGKRADRPQRLVLEHQEAVLIRPIRQYLGLISTSFARILVQRIVIQNGEHEIISGSRRKRIARGSGTEVQDVNNLLRQYAQMARMFKQMGKGGLAAKMMRGGLSGMGMGPKQKFGR